MKTLKELTWEHHKEAERQEFVKILMSGKINPELYANYLFNQHQCYNMLEPLAMAEGLLDKFPMIRRAPEIKKDFDELWTYSHKPEIMQSTEKYVRYCTEVLRDCPEKIMAHIYVRHMGDLSGGQMIRRKVPGLGKMYQFNINKNAEYGVSFDSIQQLKDEIRLSIDSHYVYNDASTATENVNNVVYEARTCFGFATNLFKDMLAFLKRNEKRFGDGTTK